MSIKHLTDKKETLMRWVESKAFTAKEQTSYPSYRNKLDMLGEQAKGST